MTPTITAKDSDEFNKVQQALNLLPQIVRSQISNAFYDKFMGINCQIADNNSTNQTIYIPQEVKQINHYDDRICIVSGEYFFVIKGENMVSKKLNYIFI